MGQWLSSKRPMAESEQKDTSYAEGITVNVSPQPQCNCADVMEPNKIGAKRIQMSDSTRRLPWRWVSGAVTIRAGWPAPHVKGPDVYGVLQFGYPSMEMHFWGVWSD